MPQEHRIKPRVLLLREGDTATFTCHSENEVTWKFKSRVLPADNYFKHNIEIDDPDVSEHTVKIRYVTKDYEGIYTCEGEEDENVYFIDSVRLSVSGKLLTVNQMNSLLLL